MILGAYSTVAFARIKRAAILRTASNAPLRTLAHGREKHALRAQLSLPKLPRHPLSIAIPLRRQRRAGRKADAFIGIVNTDV